MDNYVLFSKLVSSASDYRDSLKIDFLIPQIVRATERHSIQHHSISSCDVAFKSSFLGPGHCSVASVQARFLRLALGKK